jgi:glutaredoxin 3
VAKVDLYRHRFSADCMRAKALLDRKEVTYNEFIIDSDDEAREVMLQRSGNTSVPQIFVNGRAIDGIELLEALDASGQLDAMLGEAPRDIHAEEARASQEGQTPSARGVRGLLARFGRS